MDPLSIALTGALGGAFSFGVLRWCCGAIPD